MTESEQDVAYNEAPVGKTVRKAGKLYIEHVFQIISDDHDLTRNERMKSTHVHEEHEIDTNT